MGRGRGTPCRAKDVFGRRDGTESSSIERGPVAPAEDDDVIQTFSADRTDKTLSVRVLPRRSQRSDDLCAPVASENLMFDSQSQARP
jgi:hypothetical protein